MRRKRRPHLDMGLHDAKVKITDQGDLLEVAWGIIANAHGGDWDKASPEWRSAAEAWRERYFTSLKAPSLIQAPLAGAVAVVPAAESITANEDAKLAALAAASAPAPRVADAPQDANLEAFMIRLSALAPTEAMKEMPGWDGDDETFMDAAKARWEELQPTKYVVPSTGQEGTMTIVPKDVPGIGRMDTVEHVITKPPVDPEDAEEMQNLGLKGPAEPPANPPAPAAQEAPAPPPARETLPPSEASAEGSRSGDAAGEKPGETATPDKADKPAATDSPAASAGPDVQDKTADAPAKTDVPEPPKATDKPAVPDVPPPPARKTATKQARNAPKE